MGNQDQKSGLSFSAHSPINNKFVYKIKAYFERWFLKTNVYNFVCKANGQVRFNSSLSKAVRVAV